MNIYFTSSIKAGVENKESIKKIMNYLRSTNHTIGLRAKLADSKDLTTQQIDVDQIEGLDFVRKGATMQDVYSITQKRINKSDIVIAEMTYSSSGAGYDVAQAIAQNKPILILAINEIKLAECNTIVGVGPKTKNIVTRTYNEDNIESILEEFLAAAKSMLDSKFILIIPPEIERYLSWATKRKGVSKAEVTRAAVEKYIDHDTDYKKYMNELDRS